MKINTIRNRALIGSCMGMSENRAPALAVLFAFLALALPLGALAGYWTVTEVHGTATVTEPNGALRTLKARDNVRPNDYVEVESGRVVLRSGDRVKEVRGGGIPVPATDADGYLIEAQGSGTSPLPTLPPTVIPAAGSRDVRSEDSVMGDQLPPELREQLDRDAALADSMLSAAPPPRATSGAAGTRGFPAESSASGTRDIGGRGFPDASPRLMELLKGERLEGIGSSAPPEAFPQRGMTTPEPDGSVNVPESTSGPYVNNGGDSLQILWPPHNVSVVLPPTAVRYVFTPDVKPQVMRVSTKDGNSELLLVSLADVERGGELYMPELGVLCHSGERYRVALTWSDRSGDIWTSRADFRVLSEPERERLGSDLRGLRASYGRVWNEARGLKARATAFALRGCDGESAELLLRCLEKHPEDKMVARLLMVRFHNLRQPERWGAALAMAQAGPR